MGCAVSHGAKSKFSVSEVLHGRMTATSTVDRAENVYLNPVFYPWICNIGRFVSKEVSYVSVM